MNKHKFSSKFDCSFAHIGKESEGLSLANLFNLDGLKPLLPSDISVQDNPDVMFFVANSALINIANKNYDAIGSSDAIKIHALSKYKFLNLEHKRTDGACGVIINSGFSKIENNEIISTEEASQIKTPFNWSVAGAVWEVLNPGLVKYLIKSAGTDAENPPSLSWELFFSDYNLMIGSDNVSEAEIIDNSNETKFNELDKLLKANGGEGKTKDNIPIYRLIIGEMLPGGFAFTNSPAANIRGVLPILDNQQIDNLDSLDSSKSKEFTNETIVINSENLNNDQNIIKDDEKNNISVAKIDENINKIEKNDKKVSSQEKNSVNKNTNLEDSKNQKKITYKYMKFKNLKDITADKFVSLASDQAAYVAEELNEFCNKFASDLDIKKQEIETKANEVKELKASTEDLQKQLKDIQSKLDASEAARASDKEKNDLNFRLNDLNTKFELTEKGSKAIAKQIKGLSDEKYTEWLEFAESTFAAKKDTAKDSDNDDDAADPDDDEDDQDAMDDKKKAAKKKKDAKASDDDFDFEKIEAKKGQKVVQALSKDRDIAKQVAEAFAGVAQEMSFE